MINLFVFNCGSSSLNYKVFSVKEDGAIEIIGWGKAHRVGVRGSEPAFIEHHIGALNTKQETPIPDHRTAANLVLEKLAQSGLRGDWIGHRFVHGGSYFSESALITGESLEKLKACLPLAPIHNPNSLSVIEACAQALPAAAQYVTFDTAFHAGMPPAARAYALPAEIVERYGFRKYGFHGLSYQYVTAQAAQYLGKSLTEIRLVACHLGTGGSSVAAVDHGRPVDTSMGYSPLAGLMMSTRTGDLDPLLAVYLLAQAGATPSGLSQQFNKRSGLLGVSGFSSDIRDLERAVDERGDTQARLGFEMYTYRLKKTIGGFAALLGGLDVLIFTDDIGVQNPRVRTAACAGMEWCGIALDEAANAAAAPNRLNEIGRAGAAVRILAMPTDEEGVIAREGVKLMEAAGHADL
jgi:acetate kinase